MKKKGGKALVEQDQNAANLAVCLSVCVPFFELQGLWNDMIIEIIQQRNHYWIHYRIIKEKEGFRERALIYNSLSRFSL